MGCCSTAADSVTSNRHIRQPRGSADIRNAMPPVATVKVRCGSTAVLPRQQRKLNRRTYCRNYDTEERTAVTAVQNYSNDREERTVVTAVQKNYSNDREERTVITTTQNVPS